MITRSSHGEHGQRGVLRIIKNIVPIEKSSINQVTKHAEETAPSSNSTLYKSSLHALPVRIESPLGSHAEPATRPAPAGAVHREG